MSHRLLLLVAVAAKAALAGPVSFEEQNNTAVDMTTTETNPQLATQTRESKGTQSSLATSHYSHLPAPSALSGTQDHPCWPTPTLSGEGHAQAFELVDPSPACSKEATDLQPFSYPEDPSTEQSGDKTTDVMKKAATDVNKYIKKTEQKCPKNVRWKTKTIMLRTGADGRVDYAEENPGAWPELTFGRLVVRQDDEGPPRVEVDFASDVERPRPDAVMGPDGLSTRLRYEGHRRGCLQVEVRFYLPQSMEAPMTVQTAHLTTTWSTENVVFMKALSITTEAGDVDGRFDTQRNLTINARGGGSVGAELWTTTAFTEMEASGEEPPDPCVNITTTSGSIAAYFFQDSAVAIAGHNAFQSTTGDIYISYDPEWQGAVDAHAQGPGSVNMTGIPGKEQKTPQGELVWKSQSAGGTPDRNRMTMRTQQGKIQAYTRTAPETSMIQEMWRKISWARMTPPAKQG